MSMIIHGIHAVRSHLLEASSEPEKLLVKEGNRGPRVREIVEKARSIGCDVVTISKVEMDQIVEGHQGVVLYASELQEETTLDSIIGAQKSDQILLVLDGVTDPHNLGACMRSAATLGAAAVIAPRRNSAPLNATALKTASGAALQLPYLQVSNLARALADLKRVGFWVVGTVLEDGTPLHQLELPDRLVLVMGAEDRGLRRNTRDHCDVLASIPMARDSYGFNVSVATGICLYEAHRQRLAS